MAQRGRKSAESLAYANVSPISQPRPEPPPELNDFQAELWRRVVNSRRPDYFGSESLETLYAYVTHAWYGRELDRQIAELDATAARRSAVDPESDDALGVKIALAKIRIKLLAARKSETAQMISAARSLRITHQSVDPKTAGRRQTPATPLPWQAK